MNILVSACLIGVSCRYDGTGKLNEGMQELSKKHNLIPVCPEIFGGLSTPRTPAEICNGRVMTKDGTDVTSEYTKGAEEVLKLVRFYNCSIVILKERSPSCGYGKIYDGTFTSQLIDGSGITAKMLAEEGVEVLGESTWKERIGNFTESNDGALCD